MTNLRLEVSREPRSLVPQAGHTGAFAGQGARS